MALVNQADPMVATPSTTPDIYDATNLRNALAVGKGDILALLDNNIVTQIIPFVDGRAEAKVSKTVCFLAQGTIFNISTDLRRNSPP